MHKTPIFPPEESHLEIPDVPAKSRVRTFARPAALVLGLTVGAAACGSSSETTETLSDAPATSTAEDSDTEDSNTEDSTADESSVDESSVDESSVDESSADESAADDSSDAASSENLFPNVNVQSIDDGSIVNLAEELSGGDKAVLLWFFAPH